MPVFSTQINVEIIHKWVRKEEKNNNSYIFS